MMTEELIKKLDNISKKFEEYDFMLKEDLYELIEENNEIGSRILNTKLKKIHFFSDLESNSVGFTLDDVQVEFFVEYGEDEKGKWYEATAEIRWF